MDRQERAALDRWITRSDEDAFTEGQPLFDLDEGAMEQHLNQRLHSEYRALANTMRRKAFMAVVSRHTLEPTSARAAAERIPMNDAERRFTPGFYWTPVWTEEARRAYYGLPPRA